MSVKEALPGSTAGLLVESVVSGRDQARERERARETETERL